MDIDATRRCVGGTSGLSLPEANDSHWLTELIMRLFLLRSSLPQRHRTHTLTRCSSQVRAMCVCWVGSTSPTTVLTAVAMAGQGGCGDRC